jgi:hypothetical protein
MASLGASGMGRRATGQWLHWSNLTLPLWIDIHWASDWAQRCAAMNYRYRKCKCQCHGQRNVGDHNCKTQKQKKGRVVQSLLIWLGYVRLLNERQIPELATRLTGKAVQNQRSSIKWRHCQFPCALSSKPAQLLPPHQFIICHDIYRIYHIPDWTADCRKKWYPKSQMP